MKIEALNVHNPLMDLEALIEHNGEKIKWQLSFFDRKVFANFDIFEHTNKYLATLTEQKQTEIFNIYRNIRAIFDNSLDRHSLTTDLFNTVASLLNTHEFSDVHHWMLYHSGVHFSHNFDSEYINSVDKAGSREQTYLRSDYTNLVTLTFILRLMIPVWSEFVIRTKQETGTIFKEYYAYQLIGKSNLIHSPAVEKLTTFIEFSVSPDKTKSAAIIDGISTEDFPIWILGLVLVRKLCIGDIRGLDPDNHLITFIYNFISQKVKGIDNNFSTIIKDKIFDNGNGSDEVNLSQLESYKVKYEIPPGDIILLEYALNDPMEYVLKLAPTIDLKMVKKAIETSHILNSNLIMEPQIVLLQWVFKPIISPRGLLHLSKSTIVKALGVCQAILWHRGHHVLSGLSTAIVNDNPHDIQTSGVDSRARITKELIDELTLYYPFTKRSGTKIKQGKPINQAIASIDEIVDYFSNYSWNLTIDQTFIPTINQGSTNRRFYISHDIKIKLAELIVELAKRSYKL